MRVSSAHQIYVFSLFIVLGMVCGALFDVQRFVRRKCGAGNIRTTVEDTVFTIAFTGTMLGASFILNNGEIRYYEIMGAISGVLFYAAFLSRFFLKSLGVFFGILNKILIRPLVKITEILMFPVKKTALKFKRQFTRVGRRLKNLKKALKNRRKIIKKRVKML